MIKAATVVAVSALALAGLTGTASAESSGGCRGLIDGVSQFDGGKTVGGNIHIQCDAPADVSSMVWGWIEGRTGVTDWTTIPGSEQYDKRGGTWSVTLQLRTPCEAGPHSYRLHGGSATEGGSEGSASGPATSFTC
ncbi:MAG: hypothetical protein QOF58_4018 [Pseudonocardiales bacterium]|jgi:hypothetical protein|nr:hypothetical protein [Pseudonocardiales bacterium]